MILIPHQLVRAAMAALMLSLQAAAISAQSLPDDAALTGRGEYLARAADCMPCHTGDKSKPYAGGLALNTPFGAIYSVNITSDPETGIGRWTFAQFKNAVHDGIRADGAFLYPAMPFDAYTKIEEDDLRALWAYVRRIPSVDSPNPENQLEFPFDIRLGMLAWRELYFAPGFFAPTAGKDAEWNRGAYLVEALGHCTDCHSPRNIMGAVKGKAQFTGAELDGFYAPDIASAALAKTWQRATLTEFLKTGAVPQRTSVFGPMAEVVHDSLAYLTAPDLAAIATWLLDSPPPPDMPAPQRLSPLPAAVYQRAAKLYIDNCAACHQDHGRGIAGAVPPLAGNPAVTPAEPYNVITVVLEGLPPGGNYGAMPSFAGRLSDRQIAELADYVRTSWGNRGAANATDKMVAAWRSAAAVPDYGTQAAAAFGCPRLGGAPGASGPDAGAVAQLTAMLQGGDDRIQDLTDLYQRAAPGASPGLVVDALITAYCPVVAARGIPTWQKIAELHRFGLEAAAIVSPQAAAVPFPAVDVIWAIPAGRSLVYREPAPFAGSLSCPSADSKLLLSRALLSEAAAVVGNPGLPVGGGAAASLAASFAVRQPKTGPAVLANALIVAYCAAVTGDKSVDPAQQRAWLEDFGTQVIQALQQRSPIGGG